MREGGFEYKDEIYSFLDLEILKFETDRFSSDKSFREKPNPFYLGLHTVKPSALRVVALRVASIKRAVDSIRSIVTVDLPMCSPMIDISGVCIINLFLQNFLCSLTDRVLTTSYPS